MDQFLKRHNLPKLTQEEIDNLNRSVSSKEIKSELIAFPNGRHQAHMVTGVFYQTFKGETLILYDLLQHIEAEGILSNSVFEAGIILIAKPKAL